jgi:hypothetical protein
MSAFGASLPLMHDAAFGKEDSIRTFAARPPKVGNGPILLKNSDFGQNRKLFPLTTEVKGFGEGFG